MCTRTHTRTHMYTDTHTYTHTHTHTHTHACVHILHRIHSKNGGAGHAAAQERGQTEESGGFIKAVYGGRSILTVGDGDLTFSLSLAQQLAGTSGV